MSTNQTVTVPKTTAALFCARLIYERDLLDRANQRDKTSPRKQLTTWQRARAARLIARFRPRAGFGIAERLYQAALKDAAERGLLPVLAPLLQSAWEAHSSLVRGADGARPGEVLRRHGAAVAALLDFLPAVGTVPPQKTRETQPRAVILRDEDALILTTLADAFPAAVNQPELSALTNLPRQKISERLRWLGASPRRYVQRPQGTQRKGHGITAAGLAAIGRSITPPH